MSADAMSFHGHLDLTVAQAVHLAETMNIFGWEPHHLLYEQQLFESHSSQFRFQAAMMVLSAPDILPGSDRQQAFDEINGHIIKNPKERPAE